jgi:hypothetical protein
MSVSKRLVAVVICGSALMAPVMNARATTATDVSDVKRLMDEYHSAVTSHDGPRLAKLFVPAGSSWFNVLSDTGYTLAKTKASDALKVRTGSVESFIQFVSMSKAKLDPQHGPVSVKTDGTIASVYFDFNFVIDGKVQNKGSESWQLVKYADGWRIASIIYSSTPAGG